MALSKWLFFISLVRKIMGVKGACRSANGGGCPLLHALYIANRHQPAFYLATSRVRLPSPLLFQHSFACYSLSFATPWVFRHSTRTKRHRNRAKRGKNKHLFACFGLTSGKSETERGKNLRYFWKRGGKTAESVSGLSAFWCVHWVQVVQALWALRTCQSAGSCPLVVCSLPFSLPFVPLLLLLSCDTC